MRKGSRAANWRIAGTVDAAPRGRTWGVGGEAGDGNAGVPCHGSKCLRSETRFCSPMSRSDLAGPVVAGKSTASFPLIKNIYYLRLSFWLLPYIAHVRHNRFSFDSLSLSLPFVRFSTLSSKSFTPATPSIKLLLSSDYLAHLRRIEKHLVNPHSRKTPRVSFDHTLHNISSY